MDIISIIAGLLKDTESLIEFEEQLKLSLTLPIRFKVL